MKTFKKRDYPVSEIRRYLEPGPIVLVSSAWNGKFNIMTMGWHMVLGFSPSRVGCYIWNENHSFEMIRRSKERYANFECRLADGRQIAKHGLFIWEVVKAHVATSPKYPETFHYRGEGVFMISGPSISLRRKFKPENL